MPAHSNSGTLCPQRQYIAPTEVRVVAVSFAPKLRPGTTLTGTPTATASPSTGVTIGSVQKNSSAILIDGVTTSINTAVVFSISGCTEDQDYVLTVTCGTTGSPAETLVATCDLRCRA